MADILLEYNTLLEEITTNDWLQIPLNNYRALHNDTKPKRRRNRQRTSPSSQGVDTGRSDMRLSEEAVGFLEYLGVDRPSAVLRQIQLLDKLVVLTCKYMVVTKEPHVITMQQPAKILMVAFSSGKPYVHW